jgi:hypothetical protein
MTKDEYAVFEALNPFFKVVLKGLRGLVDGKHYFDTFAEDAIFESLSLAKISSAPNVARFSPLDTA